MSDHDTDFHAAKHAEHLTLAQHKADAINREQRSPVPDHARIHRLGMEQRGHSIRAQHHLDKLSGSSDAKAMAARSVGGYITPEGKQIHPLDLPWYGDYKSKNMA